MKLEEGKNYIDEFGGLNGPAIRSNLFSRYPWVLWNHIRRENRYYNDFGQRGIKTAPCLVREVEISDIEIHASPPSFSISQNQIDEKAICLLREGRTQEAYDLVNMFDELKEKINED